VFFFDKSCSGSVGHDGIEAISLFVELNLRLRLVEIRTIHNGYTHNNKMVFKLSALFRSSRKPILEHTKDAKSSFLRSDKIIWTTEIDLYSIPTGLLATRLAARQISTLLYEHEQVVGLPLSHTHSCNQLHDSTL